MEIHISGRFSHTYTPFCSWFIYLTMIVRNMFSVPALYSETVFVYGLEATDIKSCSATFFRLFRSLDIAFVTYGSYLSMPIYHHLSSLYMYILKIRRVGWPENGTRAAFFFFFFSIHLPHSMSCYVYLSTAQSLE
jgi:hypothetical protein